jgi:glycosyltransferase involved in cell wall biosynthesis
VTLQPKSWTVENAAWARAEPRLSVLIPFFRDDACELLRALDRQAGREGVEVVVLDDGSGDEALAARTAETVRAMIMPAAFLRLAANAGRSKGRNTLASHARAPHYLFLDSDMAPDSEGFLAGWLALIAAENPAVAFGGFTLELTPITKERALHRALALRGECRPAAVRALEPAKSLCTSNLLVRADVFAAEGFDEGFKGWGWEDVEWAARVGRSHVILHIDNTASHLGLDTDRALIGKYEQSPANFARLAAQHPEIARGFPSYRMARRLKSVPLAGLWRPVLKRMALASGLPMLLRVAATKFYRAALYAEALA